MAEDTFSLTDLIAQSATLAERRVREQKVIDDTAEQKQAADDAVESLKAAFRSLDEHADVARSNKQQLDLRAHLPALVMRLMACVHALDRAGAFSRWDNINWIALAWDSTDRSKFVAEGQNDLDGERLLLDTARRLIDAARSGMDVESLLDVILADPILRFAEYKIILILMGLAGQRLLPMLDKKGVRIPEIDPKPTTTLAPTLFDLLRKLDKRLDALRASFSVSGMVPVVTANTADIFFLTITGQALADPDCHRLWLEARALGIQLPHPSQLPTMPPVVIEWLDDAARILRQEQDRVENTPSEQQPPAEERLIGATSPDQSTVELLTTLPDLLSARDLALLVKQPDSRVELFLRRFRVSHFDCYVEVNNHRRNEPRYLYRVTNVWPALQAKLPSWQQLTDE